MIGMFYIQTSKYSEKTFPKFKILHISKHQICCIFYQQLGYASVVYDDVRLIVLASYVKISISMVKMQNLVYDFLLL